LSVALQGVGDADGDGFNDLVDKCVLRPETFNGYLDEDGCPDSTAGLGVSVSPTSEQINRDIDGDGFFNEVDGCPLQPENYNKYIDWDGCPDIIPEQSRYLHDYDLDGLDNDEDECPYDPEDYDGDRDADGCPDN